MSDNYNFKSIFKEELNYFVKYKRSLGLKYENEIYHLKYIDNILLGLKLKTKKITKETFYKLAERRNLHGKNYARRYGIVKDFCKFLISNEYQNVYYEEKKFNVVNNYKPIIFDNYEIEVLFKTMDDYMKQNSLKFYQLHYSYSILFRLLYSCGLRKTEAIKIVVDNIDFNRNIINIINSKNSSSRIVVMSESMKKCLKDYIEKFNIQGLLFKNSRGNKIINQNLDLYYKKILKKANLNINSHIHGFFRKFPYEQLEIGYYSYLFSLFKSSSIT